MKNIFKENKKLLEENKILKAQNEALEKFRAAFDDYYHKISGVNIIEKNYDRQVVLNETFKFDDRTACFTIEECKRRLISNMARQIELVVEFDVVDDPYGYKTLTGRLMVITR